jgi:hypothetical protein
LKRVQASPAGPRRSRDLDQPYAHKPFTVPVTITSRHTANKALKDAGLPKAF